MRRAGSWLYDGLEELECERWEWEATRGSDSEGSEEGATAEFIGSGDVWLSSRRKA